MMRIEHGILGTVVGRFNYSPMKDLQILIDNQI